MQIDPLVDISFHPLVTFDFRVLLQPFPEYFFCWTRCEKTASSRRAARLKKNDRYNEIAAIISNLDQEKPTPIEPNISLEKFPTTSPSRLKTCQIAVKFSNFTRSLHGGVAMAVNTFIAETDENGRISCVWIIPPDKKSPRVFDPRKHIFDHKIKANYCGARPSDIQSWLAASSRSDDLSAGRGPAQN